MRVDASTGQEFRTLYGDSSSPLNRRAFRFLNVPVPLKDRIADILKAEKIRQVDLAAGAAVTKGWVNQWMDGTAKSISYDAAKNISRKWGYAIEWLMSGTGQKKFGKEAPLASEPQNGELSQDEKALIARYRTADPRWQLSLRLLAALATEDQIEAATDVNVVVARIMGKKPAEVRYASNEAVAAAFGKPPNVAPRHELASGSTVHESSPDYKVGRKKSREIKKS